MTSRENHQGGTPGVCAFALALLLGGCVPGADEAALVLEDLAVREAPSRLKVRTPPPMRRVVAYTMHGRTYEADLYEPGSSPLAGIVLLPGVAERGRRDPRLVAFANTLARVRFLVLVPDLPGLRELQVQVSDVQGVIDSFLHLLSRPEFPDHGRTGICGFSYAVGPAVLAALKPGIRDRVDFILAIGGYYDLERVVTFFTTGYFQEKGRWRYLTPNRYGKWVFVRSNSDRVADPRDQVLLWTMAERRIDDLRAPIADLVSQLGPEGRAFYALIRNREPERVPALIARLPVAIRTDLAALTLTNKDLPKLKARLILIHGPDDNIIPYMESVTLAAAAPPDKTALFLVRGLAHVEVRPHELDRRALWRAVRTVLAERGSDQQRS